MNVHLKESVDEILDGAFGHVFVANKSGLTTQQRREGRRNARWYRYCQQRYQLERYSCVSRHEPTTSLGLFFDMNTAGLEITAHMASVIACRTPLSSVSLGESAARTKARLVMLLEPGTCQ